MPKVFALHEVELPPDVTPEEYEQLFGKELASLPSYPGWKIYLLKGDRGEATGKLFTTVRSREPKGARSVLPETGRGVGGGRQFAEQHPEATAVWESMQPLCPNLIVGPTTS